MPLEIQYDPAWMNSIADSLGSEFWVYGPVGKPLISLVAGPVKFTETVSIFIRRGHARFNLSLRPWEIQGPAVVMVRRGDILQVGEVSDDFEAHCMLFSPAMVEKLFQLSSNHDLETSVRLCPVNLMPEEMAPEFDEFYDRMKRLGQDLKDPLRLEAILYAVASFYFQVGGRLKAAIPESDIGISTRTVEVFLRLVRLHFRNQRFLDFYADKMKITSKHLTRTIRQQTGMTAGEWIDRYVVLEAKVLLRSSPMSIKEITEYLNFPNASFFSKYFRKATGQSPSEFRAK